MKPDEKIAAPIASPELKADRVWYDSLFTQLLAPLVATRYIWLALEEINPFNFRKKTPPEEAIKTWQEPSLKRYVFSNNFAAHAMGATFLGVVGVYSKNTLHDIKSIYAEAVGYELGKKPEEVTLGDIFTKSQNQAVQTTSSAYTRRTLARLATTATFFIPWHKFRDFKTVEPKYGANANVGVGAIGSYLCAEGFMRDPSFFDLEQKMVSSKINHHSALTPYASVQTQDILTLLFLQRKHRDKNYQIPDAASVDGQNDIRIAARIAELFNETYHNTPEKEQAHFTLGKFNYLIGFGHLNIFPESMGFIELANRSKDMSEVKLAASAIASGQKASKVFGQFGIDITKEHMEENAKSEQAGAKFTKRVSSKSHQDFALQTSSQRLGM